MKTSRFCSWLRAHGDSPCAGKREDARAHGDSPCLSAFAGKCLSADGSKTREDSPRAALVSRAVSKPLGDCPRAYSRRGCPQVALGLVASLLVLAGAAQGVEWETGEGTLGLRQGDTLLWQFNYGPENSKPFFHPITLPGIGVLTAEAPEDHPWHHALWFSWKYINDVNYWEQDRESGKSDGLTTWHGVRMDRQDDGSATITMELDYHLPGGPPLLEEHRIMAVSAPAEDGAFHIDWTSAFRAQDKEVVLDRTPLPEEPGGKSFGGYAGLSVRFNVDLAETRAVDSDGQITEQPERIRVKSRAVDYSGLLEGKSAGIAMLDHPENLNAPTPWYIIQAPNGPMRYFSPAVIQQGAHTMKPGDAFTLRYRVLIHPGRLTQAGLEKAVANFTK